MFREARAAVMRMISGAFPFFDRALRISGAKRNIANNVGRNQKKVFMLESGYMTPRKNVLKLTSVCFHAN